MNTKTISINSRPLAHMVAVMGVLLMFSLLPLYLAHADNRDEGGGMLICGHTLTDDSGPCNEDGEYEPAVDTTEQGEQGSDQANNDGASSYSNEVRGAVRTSQSNEVGLTARGVSGVDTIAELRAIIERLLEEIARRTGSGSIPGAAGGSGSTGSGSGIAYGTPGSVPKCEFSTMRIGSRGPQVESLQKFLNRDADTQIRGSYGGPGNETQYFGSATADAVSRFQEKHRAEVLAPVGVSSATGYFGPQSATVAKRLCGGETNWKPSPIVPDTSEGITVRGMTATVKQGGGDCQALEVDWGDGSDVEIVNEEYVDEEAEVCTMAYRMYSLTHTYEEEGEYTVTVTDVTGGDRDVLLEKEIEIETLTIGDDLSCPMIARICPDGANAQYLPNSCTQVCPGEAGYDS